MNNLIIAILSIALVAAAAGMSIYYGSTSYSKSEYVARASAFLNEDQTFRLAAGRYMLDHAISSYSDFAIDQPTSANYTKGRVPIFGVEVDRGDNTPALSTVNIRQQSRCDATINGTPVMFKRGQCSLNGVNMVVYTLQQPILGDCWSVSNPPADLSLASSKSGPVVQVCVELNKRIDASGLTFAASGIPLPPSGTLGTCGGLPYINNMQSGVCYLKDPGSASTAVIITRN